MEDLFRSFWWLIFPIMGFAFGGFGMFMGYRAHRDRMELLRIYAEKGQTPPPEIAKAAESDPYDYGYGYGYRGRWARRGPYWEWRRFIVFASLAIGFGLANYWDGGGWGWHHHGFGFPFSILTIIFGVMAVGSLLFAILATVWRDK
jgi:hypothetical protein